MKPSSRAVQTGAYLALITAVISGFSVYVNSFGVKHVPDPFVFTTTKNVAVALMLTAAVILPFKLRALRGLTPLQWAQLALLGLVGGSIPFLLFFYGLREAAAPSAAFMHKTLFVWVAIMAVPLLRERLGKTQLVALAGLVVGYMFFVGWPAAWDFGRAEIFTLSATLLWAVEAVIARRLLSGALDPLVGALGRMGLGAIIMVGFLGVTGRVETVTAMDATDWGWVAITSAFLLGYVCAYYTALKHAPATTVASILVLGSVITSALHWAFSDRAYSAEQVAGFIIIIFMVVLWTYVARQAALRPAPTGEAVHAGR